MFRRITNVLIIYFVSKMKNMIYLFPDGHLEAWRVFWQDGQQKEFGCINVSFVPHTSANPRQVNIIEFLYSIFIFLYICLCLLWVRSCLIISHICPWDPNQQNEWSKTHQIKDEWRRKGSFFQKHFFWGEYFKNLQKIQTQ